MVLLRDLLESADFGKAGGDLAREFRERHGLPDIHQLGLVVADAEAAASKLEGLGIGEQKAWLGRELLQREQKG